MSNDESMRIAKLESMRNGENTVLIDAAIQNGQTAEQVAHSIMKDRAVAKGAEVNSEVVNMIAEGINQGRQPLNQSEDENNSDSQSPEDYLMVALNQNRQVSGRE